jgi:exopolysaccharide biosynthesis polyprenyl glycosylphosphotransferase
MTPAERGRRWLGSYARLAASADAIAMAVAVAAVGRVSALQRAGSARVVLPTSGLAVLAVVSWVGILVLTGAYERRVLGGGPEEYRRVVNATLRWAVLIAAAGFALRLAVAPAALALTAVFAGLLALGHRHLGRSWLHRERSKGRFTNPIVLVGSTEAVAGVVRHLRRSPFGDLSLVGVCTDSTEAELVVDGEPVTIVGPIDRAADVAIGLGVSALAVADTAGLPGGITRLVNQLEGKGVALMVAPAITEFAGARINVRVVNGLPLLYVDEPELSGTRRWIKTVLDRLLALTLILITLPMLISVALLVRLTSRGPAIFRQTRIGLRGRPFRVWKFRTMTQDAEARLHEVIHLNEHEGVMFKIRDDPRITRVGRLLRATSIDELPQLWNVLRGDMSLVGPRPPLPNEVERYDDRARRRLLVRPGMTGLWQVSGRADLSWDDAVRLDLNYVENWSPTMDIVILFRTIKAVALRRGAC